MTDHEIVGRWLEGRRQCETMLVKRIQAARPGGMRKRKEDEEDIWSQTLLRVFENLPAWHANPANQNARLAPWVRQIACHVQADVGRNAVGRRPSVVYNYLVRELPDGLPIGRIASLLVTLRGQPEVQRREVRVHWSELEVPDRVLREAILLTIGRVTVPIQPVSDDPAPGAVSDDNLTSDTDGADGPCARHDVVALYRAVSQDVRALALAERQAARAGLPVSDLVARRLHRARVVRFVMFCRLHSIKDVSWDHICARNERPDPAAWWNVRDPRRFEALRARFAETHGLYPHEQHITGAPAIWRRYFELTGITPKARARPTVLP